jgi:hypothetical protein
MTNWLPSPVLLVSYPDYALRRRAFAGHRIGDAGSDLRAGVFGGRAHGLRLGGSAGGAAGCPAVERDTNFAAKLVGTHGGEDQYGQDCHGECDRQDDDSSFHRLVAHAHRLARVNRGGEEVPHPPVFHVALLDQFILRQLPQFFERFAKAQP